MTNEKAIEVLEYARNYDGMDYGAPSIALDMAISALRAQQKKNICGCTNLECSLCTPGPCEHRKQPNAPLTLDELRKMDGEPVWVEFQDGSGGCWGLVHITVFNHIVFANGLFCTVGKPYYGKTWLAYRQKPEEGTV